MNVKDLEFKIKVALDQGKKLFAIVATAGTTVTGSINPISSISVVAKSYGLWLHVDVTYGGALVFSKKHRRRLVSIEQANSIILNRQKWMYVARTCAVILFKN